jgi:hypothetical protein
VLVAFNTYLVQISGCEVVRNLLFDLILDDTLLRLLLLLFLGSQRVGLNKPVQHQPSLLEELHTQASTDIACGVT